MAAAEQLKQLSRYRRVERRDRCGARAPIAAPDWLEAELKPRDLCAHERGGDLCDVDACAVVCPQAPLQRGRRA